jgi:hypothetical protein
MADESVDEPEVLDTRPRGPRRSVWIAITVGCCCLIVIGLVWRATGHDRAGDDATTKPSAGDPAVTESATHRMSTSRRTVRTVDLGWVAATTDYDVFLRTTSGVVRIRPSTGRIVQTTVPGLASSGPVAFRPIDGAVLIHPLDLVPGYRVPDDGTAHQTKASGGLLLPGPDDEHVWVEGENDGLRLIADTDDGPGSQAEARIPDLSVLGTQRRLQGDGQGYVLGENIKRQVVYRLGRGGPKRLPIARPIAVGPTRVLGVAAHCTSSCSVIELDARFAKVAHQPNWTADADTLGLVSPDGRTAALIGNDRVPRVVDLHSGAGKSAWKLQAWGTDQLAFSPDGRWLFGINADKHAYAVDVRTGRSRPLLPDVAGVLQLALRGGSS